MYHNKSVLAKYTGFAFFYRNVSSLGTSVMSIALRISFYRALQLITGYYLLAFHAIMQWGKKINMKTSMRGKLFFNDFS